MSLKSIFAGKSQVDPEVQREVAVIEKVRAVIAEHEAELGRVGSEMESAYYDQISEPKPENEERLEKLKVLYAKKQSDLDLARSTLKLATEKHGAALAVVQVKEQEQTWNRVDSDFDRMIELASKIEKLVIDLQAAYNELTKITGETFNLIPEKDVRIFNDSPIGFPSVDGRLQLFFRKCGARWAKQYFGDPTKIPDFTELFKDAKAWALKRRPMKGGGH